MVRLTIDNNVFLLHDYTVVRIDRSLMRTDSRYYIRGGGVACFIHKSFKTRILPIAITN